MIWDLIQDFKHASSQNKNQILQTLITDFISVDGKYCVNINELLRKQLTDIKMDQPSDSLEHVLDILETEVELLMVDTFKRFKQSDILLQAFKKRQIVKDA